MGAEKIIERNIRKSLKRDGYRTYKIHIGRYGPEGFPDLLVIKRGITSYFEVKAPGKAPEPIQILRMKEICQAGCITAPVWSYVDVIRALKKGNI
jgi:Holliday junction resolvase